MCRLPGYIARQPVIAEQVLEDSLAAFIEVSRLHADGWGLAWYDEQGHMLVVERDTLKATIYSIAHNARSTIQEHYLSQLQR